MDAAEQSGYGIRLEWGPEGIEVLAGACAVLVVVDVLSFSTKVDVALGRGHRVTPVRWTDTLTDGVPAESVALSSPNGAALCVEAGARGRQVLAGCLRNARAVAEAALTLSGGAPIGVIPAGERWGVDVVAKPGTTGPLRPCVEDHLGAGAIVAAVLESRGVGPPSPEATYAALAFRAAGSQVGALVTGSASGRELHDHGRSEDVDHAVAVNCSTVVPLLNGGTFDDASRRDPRCGDGR